MTQPPVGWVETTIGEIARIVTGKTPPTESLQFYGGDIPFIKPPDLDGEPPLLQTRDYVTTAGAEKSTLLPPGSIAVSCIGNLGKTALLGKPAITNQQINSIVPPSALVPEYVYYWAKTLGPWLEANSSATTVAIINKGRFSRAPIRVAPLNEQRRIVTKIEDLTARSRAAKQALDAIPPLLERFRQSVLAAAFRGDLTKQWRQQNPNVEPASELLERIRQQRRHRWEQDYLAQQKAKGKTPKNDKWKEKYQEPEPVDTTGLPELPEGWCWARLSSITHHVGDVDHRMPKPVPRGGVPYISTKDFSGTVDIDFVGAKMISEDDYQALCRKIRPCKGDILLSRYGTVGQVRLVDTDKDFQASYSIAIIKTLRSQLLTDYLSLALQSPPLQSQIKFHTRATAQPDLGLGSIREFAVPFPPQAEQASIVDIVRSHLDRIEGLRSSIVSGTLLFSQLDQSILAKAFRGELVPQDPNDEPASVLLERIRAQRETKSPDKNGKKRKGRGK